MTGCWLEGRLTGRVRSDLIVWNVTCSISALLLDMCAKLWYFEPLETKAGRVLRAGEAIGTSRDHPCTINGQDIINHIHIEMYRVGVDQTCDSIKTKDRNYMDTTDRAAGCQGT